jgi:hypothetical protein
MYVLKTPISFQSPLPCSRKASRLSIVYPNLADKSLLLGLMQALKVAPKGISKDHPDIDLLKLRSIAVLKQFVPPSCPSFLLLLYFSSTPLPIISALVLRLLASGTDGYAEADPFFVEHPSRLQIPRRRSPFADLARGAVAIGQDRFAVCALVSFSLSLPLSGTTRPFASCNAWMRRN